MKTFVYTYSPGYEPSPALYVDLSHGNLESTLNGLPSVVDTGADQSVVPLKSLKEIEAEDCGEREVKTYDGQESILPLYRVRLRVWDFQQIDLVVIGTEDISQVILGRDILNRYVINLDGPNRKLQITGE